MTDRELLELAAKAAGVELLWTCGGQPVNVPTLFKGLSSDEVWNPLTDDGDAFRLMVKLKIDVAHTNIHSPQVHALADAKVQEFEDSSSDPFAATRRAIVRAAAEIGRNT